MPIKDQLINKTPQEKNLMKCREFSKIKNLPTYSKHGLDIEILDVTMQGELLRVVARALKNGKEVFVDNPLLFKNPPILVPDGTFTEITNNNGRKIMQHNYKEDLPEALRQMVAETLRLTVK